MARKYQEGEKMQTCAVRMGAAMLARIDAYGARLKAQHPGLRVERADAVRDLMLKALDLVEGHGPAGPGAAGTGPVLVAADQPADLSPSLSDQSLHKTARERTTVRQGRKRQAAAKG
jgi:hypothetical protein